MALKESISRLNAAVASKRNCSTLLEQLDEQFTDMGAQEPDGLLDAIPALMDLLERGESGALCSSVISNVACSPKGQVALARAGALPHLALLVKTGGEEHQVNALRALSNIACSDDAFVVETWNAHHADEALITILRGSSKSNEAQLSAIKVLGRCKLMTRERITALVDAGCMELLLRWLKYRAACIPHHAATAVCNFSSATQYCSPQVIVALTEHLRVRAHRREQPLPWKRLPSRGRLLSSQPPRLRCFSFRVFDCFRRITTSGHLAWLPRYAYESMNTGGATPSPRNRICVPERDRLPLQSCLRGAHSCLRAIEYS